MASFDISRPDNRVEYDIWFSSSNEKAMGFIEDFAKVDAKFGDDVLMTPRYLVWECKDCPSSFKQIHCFGDGKYCSYDKDHPPPIPLSIHPSRSTWIATHIRRHEGKIYLRKVLQTKPKGSLVELHD